MYTNFPAKRTRIFEQLDYTQVEQIWHLLNPREIRLNKGEILIYDGQIVQDCYLLQEGELSAHKLYADGYQSLILKYYPSYIIGADIAATKTKISTYHISAGTDCILYRFPYQLLAKRGLLPENERLLIMESLLALIAGENLKKMNKIEILSRSGIRNKICTFLSLQSSFFQSREFDIPFNREELAEFLCVNRSKLSYELSLMQKEGLINYHKNHFKLETLELYEHNNFIIF